jgi:outer membrane protein TolC
MSERDSFSSVYTRVAALAMAVATLGMQAAMADPAKDISLDIHSGIALALKQNPALMASEMSVSSASAGLDEARAGLFPRVDLRSTAMRTNSPLNVFGTKLLQQSVTANDMALTTLNNPSPITNYQNSVTASLPVFSGGATFGRIDEAKYGLQASMHANTMERQRVIYQVIQSFAGLEAARAMETVAKQAEKSSEEHLRVANSLFARGMVVKSDVLNAKVHLEDSQVAVITANNAEARTLDHIRALLNLDADSPLDIKEGINLPAPIQSLAQLTEMALHKRPDLLALQSQGEVAEADRTVARAGMLPHVNLVATEEWNDPRFQLRHSNYQIAAMIDLNIFAGGRDKAAMEKARAEHSRLEFQIIDKSHQIKNEVADAYRGLHEVDQRLQSRQEALAQAEESLRITDSRYKAGLERMADLLLAQTQLDQARADVIQARFDQIVTRAQLYMAAGQLTPEVLQ